MPSERQEASSAARGYVGPVAHKITFDAQREPMFQDEQGNGWVPLATYNERCDEVADLKKAARLPEVRPMSAGDARSAASPSPQVVFGLDGPREILDACCGGRMWWWHKKHPLAAYMDIREAPRGSVGELTGRPEWNPNWSCEPDICGDFRAMPWADESFQMVVFDPPHVTREKQPPEGINGLKYGALHPDTEQEDLRRGFAECWRVLRPGGTLVFKWGAGSIKRVEPHFPATPIVGTRSPRGGQTRWFIFYKPLVVAELEAVA